MTAGEPAAEAVRVAVQVRPLLPFEHAHDAHSIICTSTSSTPSLTLTRASASALPSSPAAARDVFSSFDAVYAPADPCALFADHVSPLLASLYEGINATVFAYGQTCAGKSYTMSALTSLVVDDIFTRRSQLLNQQRKDQENEQEQNVIVLRVSFVEIYRETIRDLIEGGVTVNVRTRSTASGKPTVFLDGAKERTVETAADLQAVISDGLLLRRTAATGMNASSSRSHSIITLSLIQTLYDDTDDDSLPRCLSSKIHLVDLAGSERSKRTRAQGARFAEGVDINKGLFALAKVISTLADNAQRAPAPQRHVPYRDSKLTRLLQDSLGGSARTLLVACVSPASSSAEETLGTLRYAQRAKHIRNKPTINTDASALEVSDLRAALARARAKMAVLVADNERLRRTGTSEDTEKERERQQCAVCARRRRREQEWVGDVDMEESEIEKVDFMKSTLLPSPRKRINTVSAAARAALSSSSSVEHGTGSGMGTPYPRRVTQIPVVGTLRHSHTLRRALASRPHQLQQVSSKTMTSEPCKSRRARARSPVNSTGTRGGGHRRRSKSATPSSSSSRPTDIHTHTRKRHKQNRTDEDEDEGVEVVVERALGESRVEDVRRALTDRLRQAEADKVEIEAARGVLLQRLKRVGGDTDTLRSKVRTLGKENRSLKVELNRVWTAKEKADASVARMRTELDTLRGQQKKAVYNNNSSVGSMRAGGSGMGSKDRGNVNMRRVNSSYTPRYHSNSHSLHHHRLHANVNATKQPLRNHAKALRE